MPEETVTISKQQYDSLVEDSEFLQRLQDGGVDNWPGYSDCYTQEKFEAAFG
ncbi:host RecBCD nuclease inhibitor [Rhodococcus phage Trina]|uniref:Uncharacterized protein n=1 Tax=Rhodococcus phage Trina TaxID=2027905 RepID=A0A2D0ZN15_9CAUD|nr:host RecBCD nuclease inhibitor [Rhodococcus phage Trina]ASZ74941.1 hypothetical protein SEA_TRINA_134 [Rhodococcus phage Trina]